MLVISRTQKWNSLSHHFHKGLEILLVLAGEGKMYINTSVYQIQRGSLFVLNSTDFHHNEGNDHGEMYKFCAIDFEPEEVSSFSTPDCDLIACFLAHQNFNHRYQLDAGQLANMTKQIKRLGYYLDPACNDYGKDIYCKICLTEILIYINSIYKTPICSVQPQYRREIWDKAYPIIQYIKEHYADNLSLEELASMFYISKSQLCRTFKQATGVTLNTYINNLRMFKAMDFLRAGYSVNITAEMIGFKSTSYFISTFTKLEGISPKHYSRILTSAAEFKWHLSES